MTREGASVTGCGAGRIAPNSVPRLARSIKSLIEHEERTDSRVFHYLGANQDAIEVGAGPGRPGRRPTDLRT
ncbi:hypothetical protein MWU75_09985 [Ornithinimicrobium sp. F0845]|uniref:hypothetical protein n=1 Tax=Ornithinimicrobium sp. F0845 TaxID=2926412 RepID=UPI001FF6C435|nr:hypothetical protein [Ornithinimicrobium sp. F0845]MCK0112466.1 hypothetical protein [Ornithinimicrobium sp. F0845]